MQTRISLGLIKTCIKPLLVVVALLFSLPSMGHHSRTMFDAAVDKTLRGTVSKFDFVNPHAFIIMSVTNEDGSSTTWQLEGGNAMGLIRQGWRPDSLKQGDEIEVVIHPLRSGAPGGEWRADKILLFVDGAEAGIPPTDRNQ